MSSTGFLRKPAQRAAFSSAREACRYLLRSARTMTGRYLPVSVADIAAQLSAFGFPINERDVEGLLRELSSCGEAVEIDAQAGFRWDESAA